jgi:hypothetical protein
VRDGRDFELLTRPLPPVRRVAGVDGPAVCACRRREASVLFCLFGCIVVGLAKALKRTIPKLVRVAAVALNVVANRGACEAALQPAHAAERFNGQLVKPGLAPAGGGIPPLPRPALIITYPHTS